MYKLIVTIALSFLIVTPVFAHIAVEDGKVFAVLHIDPGDSPIVNEPAQLHFNFTGSKEMFNASECDCSVSISSKGQTLFDKKATEAEFSRDTESISLNYTFPHRAIYTIVLYGHTHSTAISTSFKLSYDVRVDRGDAMPNAATVSDFFVHTLWHHFSHIIIFGGAFLIGGYFTYKDWKNKKINN